MSVVWWLRARWLSRKGWAVLVVCGDHDVPLRALWGGSKALAMEDALAVLDHEQDLHAEHRSFRSWGFGAAAEERRPT